MRQVYARQGTTRLKTRFLFFPREIGNERRWLERATWEEMAEVPYRNQTLVYWRPTCWVDDVEKYHENVAKFNDVMRRLKDGRR